MPFVPAPNIVMVEIRALQDGQRIENRVMVNALTAVTPAVVLNITNAVANWAANTYFLNVTSTVELIETVGTDLSVANGFQATVTPDAPTFGGLGNNPMPNESSFCVSLRSTARGRSARGRFYAMGLDKGVVSANRVTSTYRTNITNALQDLADDLAGAAWKLSIVSYRTNNAPRPGGPVYFVVTTAVSVDDIVDSMRRRKPGVGS